MLRPGKSTAKLKLNRRGAEQISSCTARTIKISGKGVKVSFDLRRTGKCKPKPIDLSQAESCDLIVVDDGAAPDSLCMLPFPDNFHTVADESTETGRLVAFDDAAMPPQLGRRPDRGGALQPQRRLQPGSDGRDQGARPRHPGGVGGDRRGAAQRPRARSSASRQPVVVIDAKTGERWPIWVEIDSNALDPRADRAADPPRAQLRGRAPLRRRDAQAQRRRRRRCSTAPEGFRYYRDDLPVDEPASTRSASASTGSSGTLRKAEIKRKNLYLAWDFTVSSDENIAAAAAPHPRRRLRRARRHRPRRRRGAGRRARRSRSPRWRTSPPPRTPRWRGGSRAPSRCPCYLTAELRAGRPLRARRGRAARAGTAPTRRASTAGSRAPPSTPRARPPGGRRSTATGCSGRPRRRPRATSRSSARRTTSSSARPTRSDSRARTSRTSPGTSSPTSANFPELTDRVQQGLLNELFLGRLMIHADGFLSDAAFHVDDTDAGSPPVLDTSRLYYNGNSQGGILGGAADRGRPRLHPGVARRPGDELLGAAQPLGRLRHLQAVPRPGLPEPAGASSSRCR